MNYSNYLVFQTILKVKSLNYIMKSFYIQVLFYSWFGINKKYKSQIKVLFNKTIKNK